jgi:hypothetical protein
MDENYDEKEQKHATNYKVNKRYIHPIVFSENLSISQRSFTYLKSICPNIKRALTRVGLVIVMATCMRENAYYRKAMDQREDIADLYLEKLKAFAPKDTR